MPRSAGLLGPRSPLSGVRERHRRRPATVRGDGDGDRTGRWGTPRLRGHGDDADLLGGAADRGLRLSEEDGDGAARAEQATAGQRDGGSGRTRRRRHREGGGRAGSRSPGGSERRRSRTRCDWSGSCGGCRGWRGSRRCGARGAWSRRGHGGGGSGRARRSRRTCGGGRSGPVCRGVDGTLARAHDDDDEGDQRGSADGRHPAGGGPTASEPERSISGRKKVGRVGGFAPLVIEVYGRRRRRGWCRPARRRVSHPDRRPDRGLSAVRGPGEPVEGGSVTVHGRAPGTIAGGPRVTVGQGSGCTYQA